MILVLVYGMIKWDPEISLEMHPKYPSKFPPQAI